MIHEIVQLRLRLSMKVVDQTTGKEIAQELGERGGDKAAEAGA
jgi:hypothetical protein